jgi:hypothetical protein
LSSHPDPKTRYDEIEKSGELFRTADKLYEKAADKAGPPKNLPGKTCV